MVCRNCGWRVARAVDMCRYCWSPPDAEHPTADGGAFQGLLAAVSACDSDVFRIGAVRGYAKPLTVGQVRAVLATFHSDVFRIDAARSLATSCVERVGLMRAGDVFDSDVFRAEFFRIAKRTFVLEGFDRIPTTVLVIALVGALGVIVGVILAS